MGGRGAASPKTLREIARKKRIANRTKEAAKAVKNVKSKETGFNRLEAVKKFSDPSYRKANTPKGAKSFITMFQRQDLSSVLAKHEDYAIAKWAHSKGHKNLDKKSKKDIHKILSEYAKHHNTRLGKAINSPDFKWYKFE